MGTKQKISVLAGGVLLAFAPVAAFAVQPAPGAPTGGILLDQMKGTGAPAPEKAAPELNVQHEARPAFRAPEGFRIKVNGFHITGASAFPEAVLLPLVDGYVGREVGMADLDQAAAEISKYYRQHGYFVARAYLPAQEIKGGIVEITMIEGRLGDVKVKVGGSNPRLSEPVATRTVESSAKVGDVVQDKHLERGLLLLNDLPGVNVKSTLVPGATSGTSDLLVDATEGKRVTGSVDGDSFGNKFTGVYRAGATVNINDPTGHGDLITLRGMTAGSGLNYGRLSYMIPVGYSGLKVGAAYYQMKYQLGGVFSALNAQGDAKVASLYGLYPIVRSRNYSLYGNVGFDSKKMTDQSLGFSVDDKKANVYTLGVNGDARDAWGSGGMSSYALTLTHGNLSGVLSDYILPANAQSRGGYDKLNYSVTTLRRVTDLTSVYLSLAGQMASKNLDASEKFILGGPYGVRAYPQGEAAGDSGALLTAEARFDVPQAKLPGNFQFVGFFDAGQVTMHQTTWALWQGTNPYISNNYTLAGAGIGINFVKPDDYLIHITNAWTIGNNPGRDIYGNNSDGSNSKSRFWIQAVKWF